MNNKYKNIKYIISDLDGTIIGEGSSLLESTKKDIIDFQKKTNYKFIIATGRIDTMIKEFIDKIEIKLPVISANGALIKEISTNKVLRKVLLNKETCYILIKRLEEHNIDVILYTVERIYTKNNSLRISDMKKYNEKIAKKESYKMDYVIVDDYNEIIKNHEIIKMVVTYKNNKEFEIVKKLTKDLKNVTFSSSFSNIIDINSSKATKGTGVQFLCKYLNISKDEFIVYGDNMNDKEMFKFAKYSVATKNALPYIKSIASEVCDFQINNGVGKHIRKHFL